MLLSAHIKASVSFCPPLSPLQEHVDPNFSSAWYHSQKTFQEVLLFYPVTIFHLKQHPCHQNQTALSSNTTSRTRTELQFRDNLKARTLSFIWLQFHSRPYLLLLIMACKQHHAKLRIYYPNKLNSFLWQHSSKWVPEISNLGIISFFFFFFGYKLVAYLSMAVRDQRQFNWMKYKTKVLTLHVQWKTQGILASLSIQPVFSLNAKWD